MSLEMVGKFLLLLLSSPMRGERSTGKGISCCDWQSECYDIGTSKQKKCRNIEKWYNGDKQSWPPVCSVSIQATGFTCILGQCSAITRTVPM